MISTTDTSDWPPSYTLHRSPRARSVRLHICRLRGLRVVVPSRFDAREIPRILEHHRKWIEKKRLEFQVLPPISVDEVSLPNQIDLRGINETWQVLYTSSKSKAVRLEVFGSKKLVIQTDLLNKKAIHRVLRKWLREYAETQLTPWLKQLGVEFQLDFISATVRHATTRWGSCSSRKTISLNANLLFLPEKLVKHVMLHELSHTIHMNHSASFWALLEKVDSDCILHRAELKKAHQFVPAWAERQK